MEVKIELLKNVPYINLPGIKDDGRGVSLDAYFEPGEGVFKAPFFFEGEYRELRPEDLVAFYYSTKPANPTLDVSLSIFNTMNKKYFYNKIANTIWALMQDFVSLSGIIEIYFILCERSSRRRSEDIRFLVRNLLEYLLFVIRSAFDLIQKITKNVVFMNRGFEIPGSFNDMFRSNGDFRSGKWPGIPEEIVDFYKASYPFFLIFKDLRDAIGHRDVALSPIYDLYGDFGLGIKMAEKKTVFTPFGDYGVWPVEERKPNDIGSTLSFIIFGITELIKVTDVLSESLIKSFPITPLIKNEYGVYFRGGYTHHLLDLEKFKINPWAPFAPSPRPPSAARKGFSGRGARRVAQGKGR